MTGIEGTMVYVIGHDSSLRRSLVRLLRSNNLRAQAAATVAELPRYPVAPRVCVVLDLRSTQRKPSGYSHDTVTDGEQPPCIVIVPPSHPLKRTSHLPNKIVALLETPCEETALLSAVSQAFEKANLRIETHQEN